MNKLKSILALFIFTFSLNINDIKVLDAMDSSSKIGMVKTSGSNLNVRSSASSSSKIITKLKNNSYITIISTSGNYHKVEYQDNKFGYVHKSYISNVSSTIRSR